MAGKAPVKGVPVKYLYLDGAPAALAKIEQGATGSAKNLITRIDSQLAWPDKPGVPPPPVIVPLDATQQALFDKGKTIYATLCAACHQPAGTGTEGLAPPLVDSEWVLGPADRLARIVLHGLSGPVSVAGTTWRLEMPPLAALPDADIAAALTYIRREWEHNAAPVTPADVAKIRAAYPGRTKAWSAEELLKPAPAKQAKSK